MREEFRRQRRNTIAISLVLFLYGHASVSLDKVVILGNSFDISNPDAVPTALWLAWSYFTIRMLQYMHDLGDLGLGKSYYERLHVLVPRIAFRKYCEGYDKQQHFGEDYGPVDFTYSEPSVTGAYRTHWEVQFTTSASARKRVGTGLTSTAGCPVDATVDSREIRWAKVRAFFHVSLKTHLLTEYALPVTIALLPVLQMVAARLQCTG